MQSLYDLTVYDMAIFGKDETSKLLFTKNVHCPMGGSLFLDPCRRFTQVNWKSELSQGIDSTGFNLGDRKYEKKNNSYIENYPTK